MRTIKVYEDQTEAFMAKGYLESQGLKVELIGAKDYVSHYTGRLSGKYELQVEVMKQAEALELLDKAEASVKAKDFVPTEVSAEHFFRKALIHAVWAVILFPIVFNYTSIRAGFKFWNKSDKTTTDQLKVFIILLLQIPAIVTVYLIREFAFSFLDKLTLMGF